MINNTTKMQQNMKKGLFVLTLLMMLGMGLPAMAQKHRHTPREAELVDSTHQQTAVELYSDTTATAQWEGDNGGADDQWDDDMEDFEFAFSKLFGSMNSSLAMSLVFSVIVIVIVFVLSPLLIIFAIFYFVNKNRKQQMKLAQMAMEKGQPIPESLLEKPNKEIGDEYQKGLRQCFVGIGLAVFLGYAAGDIGFGIGVLVFFIGLGKVVAAKSAGKKNDLNHHDLIK